ncbi:hypothetical protein [Burkholderia cepacia]|nr:hypothetical protein [Burkholderia cepacia]MDO5947595.1 hypothetical protein [Burkholderia cepacia]
MRANVLKLRTKIKTVEWLNALDAELVRFNTLAQSICPLLLEA